MKFRLTKEQFEALNDEQKKEYVADGEGFKLNLEDIADPEDNSALKRAKDREKQRADEAEAERKKLQDKLDAVSNDDARKRGDIEALEKSWKQKETDAKAAGDAAVNAFKGKMEKLLVNDVAMQIAVELTKTVKLILPHIKARLKAEFDGEDAITRVLDADGKPSALSIEDLKKEFRANPDFADIIIGSKASGSGARGGNGGGASKKLSEMNDADRIEFAKNDPEGFKRAVAEQRKAAA